VLPLDPADRAAARQTRLKELTRHDWVVYAKTPLAGPEVVLDYLSRYTHRVAVSNERIVGIDTNGVHLRVRADDRGGKRTTLIDGQTFIARASCSLSCRPASNASATTGCSVRRPRPSGWPRRTQPWRCRRRIRRRVKMRPHSSNTWQASKWRAGRTAVWGTGKPSRYYMQPRTAPTAMPLNAEVRRDASQGHRCRSPSLSLSKRRWPRSCLRAR
jgi:hypothetical protein